MTSTISLTIAYRRRR